MEIEGFIEDSESTLYASVGESVTLGLNAERDTVWISQSPEYSNEVVIVPIQDAPELIKKLQAWVDASKG